MMSAEVGFDFASAIDACGHVMWVWHRKMSAENHGLAIIKPATKRLGVADLPANWHDHIEVVKGRRTKVRINQVADDDVDPFEALASSRKIISLDDSTKPNRSPHAIRRHHPLGCRPPFAANPHQSPERAIEGPEGKALKLVGIFKTISEGRNPGTPNCFLFPLPNGAWRVYRFSPGITEADTWTQDGQGWTTCYFNHYPDLKTACTLLGGVEPEQGGYIFSTADAAIQAAKSLGEDSRCRQHRRPQSDAQGPQRRPAGRGDRTEERDTSSAGGLGRQEGKVRQDFHGQDWTKNRTTNSTSTSLTTSSERWRRPPSSTPAG